MRRRVRTAIAVAAIGVAVSGCDDDDPGGGDPQAVARVPDDVPGCGPVATWNSAFEDQEAMVLEAINAVRADGARCGGDRHAPVPPLRHLGTLRCAARLHTADMAARQFFDHTDPDGRDAWDRIADTTYAPIVADELIAAGEVDATMLVDDAWLQHDRSCAVLMAPGFTDVGIGHIAGITGEYSGYWTVVFAAPEPQ